jgi:hypothetical protein
LIPPNYYYSMGHALRLGTSGEFKHSPSIIAGFLFWGLAVPLAPLYSLVFLWRLINGNRSCSTPDTGPAPSNAAAPKT